jgi:oxygen-independent coproporphyrinogen-3 oxidase
MQQSPPLALYIHWPFCKAKCPYCDFNSHVREGIEAARWVRALLAEMRFWHEKLGPRTLTSIFFGGGTPSLLPPPEVATLIETATRLWPAAADIEITLEANPTSSEAQKFHDFAAAGVNRLSLGVQSLRDDQLKFLGRQHDVKEAKAAIAMAQAAFPRTSFDLIYARKEQRAADWEVELKEALELAAGHLSLYQLTIEPGTVFAQKTAIGSMFQADDEEAAKMYEITQELCAAAGLPAYEVSNHAAAGQQSNHNLSYWHYDEYAGIGPGAHGRTLLDGQRFATQTLRPPETWLRNVEAGGHGLEVNAALEKAEEKAESFMMNLRLCAGIDKAAWQARHGEALEALLDPAKIKMLATEKLVEDTPQTLRVTQEGMLKLTAITGSLLS